MHARTIVLLIGLAVFLIQASCSEETQPKAGSVISEEAAKRKLAVEENLLTKVHFVGEERTNHTVFDRMEYLHVPAVSFALIRGGQIEWTEGYGVKSLGTMEAVTSDTLFQAASLSKPVTLMAAMRMHDAGLIDLDADIQTYLADYQLPDGAYNVDNPVTFRNILSHTSGLTAGGFMGYEQDAGFPTDIEVLMGTGVTNSGKVEAPQTPGAELAYSGRGYTVAELAMQDVTGDSFKTLMDTWLLYPAAMANSDFAQPLPTSKHESVARGHHANGTPVKGGWHNYPEQAAAGLWSTAGDMAIFMIEIYKAYHGKSDFLDRETVRKINADQRDGHVFGFLIDGEGEESLSIRHYGGNAGYRSFMIIYLETGDGAAYLSNSDNGGVLGAEVLYTASKVYGWPTFHQTEVTRASRSVKELKDFVGVYEFNEDLRVEVDYSDAESAIGVNFPNGDRYPLVPITGGDEFINPENGVTVSFGEKDITHTLTVYGDTATKVK